MSYSPKVDELVTRMEGAAKPSGDPESSHSAADHILVAALREAAKQSGNGDYARIADLWEEHADDWWWA